MAAVRYLEEREMAWLGQTVVARRERDGFYYPGDGACAQILITMDHLLY